MAAFEVLAALVALFGALYYYMTSTADFWEKRGVPYIKPVPFIGSSRRMLLMSEFRGAIFQRFYNHAKSQGYKYIGIFQGRSPALVAVDLDFIKTVMVKDFQSFTDHGVPFSRKREPLTAHLFNLEGSEWKNLRAKLTPTFTSGKMKAMFHLVRACAEEFREYLRGYAEAGLELEMSEAVAKFTTDVIGTCAFGIEANSMKDPNAAFRVMGRKAFDITPIRAALGLIGETLPWLRRILPIKPIDTKVTAFFTKTFNENVEYREKNKIVRNDFIDLLIQLKNHGRVLSEKKDDAPEPDDRGRNEGGGIDEAILPAQAFIFFLAGFETSSGTMSACLTELAHHPDIQERLRAEVDQVLAKHDGQVTYEALQEMTYMEQVLEETMRLYPALANIPREVTRDYPLPDSKGVLEKGTRVQIPVYAIHRDPDIYPDPDRFDPERFTAEMKRDRHPYAYLPFGEGPRICIGLRFAMMQMKSALALVMQSYQVHPCEETIYPIQLSPRTFVTKIIGGAKLKLTIR